MLAHAWSAVDIWPKESHRCAWYAADRRPQSERLHDILAGCITFVRGCGPSQLQLLKREAGP